MPKFYLCNNLRFGNDVLSAGKLLDSNAYDTIAIQNAGGILWPDTDVIVAAAAARAQNAAIGGESDQAEQLMRDAVTNSQRTATDSRMSITGSRGDGSALANLLTALATAGIINDQTTP